MLRGLVVLVATVSLVCAAAARADSPPFSFWPQGGVIGADLYLANFVDLDPAPGAVLDPFCGSRTYDTHTGDDVLIRSFREESIGVPIFSATDGTVLQVQDGLWDWNYGSHTSPFDNHVMVESPDGRVLVYGHLRHGIKLHRGSVLRAGQQIGWNGSSGNSSWPHLHFTEVVGESRRDAFAGPCRAGPSDFAVQPSWPTAPYVRNLVVSPKPFKGEAQLPWDKATRTGTFVAGVRDIWFRVELGEYLSAAVEIELVRPDGSVALDDPAPTGALDGEGQGHGAAAFDFHERLNFDALGTWRLRYSLGGSVLADAPIEVVANAAEVRNRAPVSVGVTLSPAAASVHAPVVCTVVSPLVARDPDYDVVRYRYVWTAGGAVVRAVTSAGLADVLARDTVKASGTIGCSVTPSDGRLAGLTASGSVTASG